MYLFRIIPITRSSFQESLTYFGKTDIPLGGIVSIKLRNKPINGIVIEKQDIRKNKLEIKQAGFKIKRIEETVSEATLPRHFIRAVQKYGDNFFINKGKVIKLFCNQYILQNKDIISSLSSQTKNQNGTFAFQDSFKNRISFYKNFLKENKDKTIAFFFPTNQSLENTLNEIKKACPEEGGKIVVLKSKTTKNKIEKIYKEKEVRIFFALASFSLLPTNPDILIVERESHGSWRDINDQINGKDFLKIMAEEMGSKIILADTILSTNTINSINEKNIKKLSSLNWGLKINIKIIDQTEKEDHKIISKELLEDIEKNKNYFIFCLRKGYGNTTVCHDCGEILKKDDKPLVLYHDRKTGKRYYKVSGEQELISPNQKCANCDSWNLVPLGVGAQKVFEEIKEVFPKRKIFLVERESLNSESKIKKEIDTWQKEGGILVGTETALKYIDNSERIAIASFDTLFNLPILNLNEKIINLLIELKNKTKNKILIQTRNPRNYVINKIKNDDTKDIVDSDLKTKKELLLPPFQKIIKIESLENIKNENKWARYIKDSFGESLMKIFIKKLGQRSTLVAILKTSLKNNEKSALKELQGANFRISIDPEKID